jgi:(1->4)-alpha-D-glucan 1-alpha-D-glucosylmutase
MLNSLSQTLLKLTCPGVPDIYQGNEIWDFSLVDPDNRRPVDYAQRRELLTQLHEIERREPGSTSGEPTALLKDLESGFAKLLVTSRALHCRKSMQELFNSGDYIPLPVRGSKAAHVCSFARQTQHEAVVIAVPRLIATLLGDKKEFPMGSEVWGDTRIDLPENFANRTLRNALTDQVMQVGHGSDGPCVPMATALQQFPVALLVGDFSS